MDSVVVSYSSQSRQCDYWKVRPASQYVVKWWLQSEQQFVSWSFHACAYCNYICFCESKNSRTSSYQSWVIMLKREILQCHRYQEVCSYEVNFNHHEAFRRNSQSHSATKIRHYLHKYLVQHEIERSVKVWQLHMKNISRAEMAMIQRCRVLVKWKAWPIIILIKVCFFLKL